MQLGMVGLGRMGANMVDADYSVTGRFEYEAIFLLVVAASRFLLFAIFHRPDCTFGEMKVEDLSAILLSKPTRAIGSPLRCILMKRATYTSSSDKGPRAEKDLAY